MPKENRSKSADRFQKSRFSPYVTEDGMSKAFQKHSDDMKADTAKALQQQSDDLIKAMQTQSDDLMKRMEALINGAQKDVRLPLMELPKKIDNKKGLIRFPFNVNNPAFSYNGIYSKNLYFASTKWYLVAEKSNASNCLCLSFWCEDFIAALSFRGSFTLSLLGTVRDVSRTENFCFMKGKEGKGISNFISWKNLVDPAYGFVDEMGNVVIEAEFTANAFTENGPAAVQKSACYKHDAVLLIGGRGIGVSKVLLSAASPYFNDLFNRRFRERNPSEIVIKDVDLAAFIYLLDATYDTVDDYATVNEMNVESLLRLSDRFRVQKVMKQCESFLMQKNSNMEMGRKVMLSREYRLSKLKDFCFKHYKKLAEDKQLQLTINSNC